MPHKIKSAPEHYTGLQPSNPSERRFVLKFCIYAALAIAAVIGLRLLQQHWHRVRELTWTSATGKIEDVRPVLVGKFDGNRGGSMLYQVQVLVTYRVKGNSRTDWITVRQTPEIFEDVQAQAQRWKGALCTVRWNPSNPSQIDAEIS